MSRTDHSRKPGSHTVLTAAERRLDKATRWSEVDNGFKRPILLAKTDIDDVLKTDEPVAPRLCKFCRAPLEDLAEWERELLKEYDDTTGEWVDSPAYDYCDYACMGDHGSLAADGFIWSVSDDTLDYTSREIARDRFLDDDEGYEETAWLPLMTIEDCREAFGGSDFTIQHTNVLRRTR